MKRTIPAILLFSMVISGCTNMCRTVGQQSGAFSSAQGWTGVANVGLTGIFAGICATGLAADKAKKSQTTETVELDRRTIEKMLESSKFIVNDPKLANLDPSIKEAHRKRIQILEAKLDELDKNEAQQEAGVELNELD